MDRATLEATLSTLAHGPFGEAPRAVGRIPDRVGRLAIGWVEPQDLLADEVALAPAAQLGPAYALGDALWAHPDAYPSALAQRLGLRGITAALAVGRSALRKIAVFVPLTHLGAVRDAVASAGAGFLGGYRDCTFAAEGTGTFLPLPGSDPFIGIVGTRAEVPEARLETVYPAYREDAVIKAVLSSHPYEQPAYDICDLRSPEPTYGSARLGTIDPTAPERFAQKVRAATDAKDLRWSAGTGQRVARVLVLGDPRSAALAVLETPDAIVSPPLLPWDAAALASAGCTLIEVDNFLPQALAHFADRLLAQVHLEVRFNPEGFNWRRLRSRDGTIPS
ncbi:MAG: hypothetical protein M0Z66_12420 [Thermaerobacter sp.]|nr:hypothetical protein [Thermaerobacter sp.]